MTTVTVYDAHTGAALTAKPSELAAALFGSGWYPDASMKVREAIIKLSRAVRRGEPAGKYANYLGVVVDTADQHARLIG